MCSLRAWWGWVACTHHAVLMDIREQVMESAVPRIMWVLVIDLRLAGLAANGP